MTINFGGNESKREENWENLLWSADNDFISIVILWYSRVTVGSTSAWMFSHSLEKYFKAYFKQLNPDEKFDKKNGEGHDVKKLWKRYKENRIVELTLKPELNIAFDQLIQDVSTIKTKQRYIGQTESTSKSFIYFYIVLASYLRYIIIGKEQYRKALYGLGFDQFYYPKYTHEIDAHGKIIIQKVLHLCLEHGIAITNFGEIIPMDMKNYSLSNTSILIEREGCPICKAFEGKQTVRITNELLLKAEDYLGSIVTKF